MTRRWIAAGALVALSVTLTGCTAATARPTGTSHPATGSVKLALVAYDTCDSLLAKLRGVASAAVQPYGLPGSAPFGFAEDNVRGPVPLAAAAPGGGGATAYSGTNNQEVGVDEPDLVKTDGHRIVTVQGGVLRVIDAATRKITGSLRLSGYGGNGNLLLQGDRALVLEENSGYYAPTDGGGGPAATDPAGPRILLVDLSGSPRIVTSYAIDGQYVDARQVGDRVNVVIRSQPRIVFPYMDNATDKTRIAKNRDIIRKTRIADWLPRIAVTEGGTTTRGTIPCGAVLHPAAFQDPGLLTVLTFHLDTGRLGNGDPVGVVADGGTVYASDKSLYVADDQRVQVNYFRGGPMMAGGIAPVAPDMPIRPSTPAADPGTTVYRFDTSMPGRPVFVGSGHVPGYLVNQYAMSEWSGVLRVATTTGTSWAEADGKPAGAQTSESAVYTFGTDGPTLRMLGHVGGLGRGERIYSVRYVGPVAYVVTFRQTDPLFTVDLSDPARPAVRGELPLTGYSSYLHPASGTRIIGIGQSADSMGHVGGTQVSVFDVSDLSAPRKVGGISFPGGSSDAEYDPHAFLYWPATNLVVAPLNAWGSGVTGVVLLRITDSGPTEIGTLSQPADSSQPQYVQRSLIIGDTLWTVSDGGVMATDSTTLRQDAWLPFN